MMCGTRLAGPGIVAGIAIGLLTWLADQQENAVAWLGSLTAPWVLLAFLLGTLAGRIRPGVAVSVIAMLIGVAIYYACMRLFAGGASIDYLMSSPVVWLLLAPLAGVVAGGAGALWRDDRHPPVLRGLAVGFPGGLIAGESAYFMATSTALTSAETLLLFGIIAIGVSMPAFLPVRRARLAGFGFVMIFALAGATVVPIIRLLVRLVDS